MKCTGDKFIGLDASEARHLTNDAIEDKNNSEIEAIYKSITRASRQGLSSIDFPGGMSKETEELLKGLGYVIQYIPGHNWRDETYWSVSW